MIFDLPVLLVKLIIAGILLRDRKNEVKLWGAVCLICSSLYEVSEFVGQAGAASPYLTFVYQVLMFVRVTGMPYAFLMAAVSYMDLQSPGMKRTIGLLLLLPPAVTAATLQNGLVKFDQPFFLAWTSAYFIATVLLMLGYNAFTRSQAPRRSEAVELFIIVPNAAALLMSYYLSEVLHGWNDSLFMIVTLTSLLLFAANPLTGAPGVKLRKDRPITPGELQSLSTGTNLLRSSLRHRLAAIDPPMSRIGDRSEEDAEDVRLIRQEMELLLGTIGRMRHRTEFIELSEQPYSLNELVRAAMDACADYRSEKNAPIRFRTDLHAVVRCDKTHMQELFVSLLHNALDALPDRGGAVEIRLERIGRRLKLEFIDNGHGIAAEHLPKLWEPFFTTREPPGHLGLGLTYCAMAAEKHGGKLTIESKPGQGATVRLLLPMRRVAALASSDG